MFHPLSSSFFFFFNDTATTEIYTLSLHDALPISVFQNGLGINPVDTQRQKACRLDISRGLLKPACRVRRITARSEEHTSELQSRLHLVCRLLLEKKKIQIHPNHRLLVVTLESRPP